MTKKTFNHVYIYAISYVATISILVGVFIIPMMIRNANSFDASIMEANKDRVCITKYSKTVLDCPPEQPTINLTLINWTVQYPN